MDDQLTEDNGTQEDGYVFRLFVTGASPNSSRAITNIKLLFEKHFNDNYELEIIDVYQQPEIATKENIIALPLLIRKLPLPELRLIGDMSDVNKILTRISIVKEQL